MRSSLLVSALLLASCTDDPRRTTPGPPCAGDHCAPPPTSGGGPTGAGGGGTGGSGAGGLEPGELSGTIGVLVDEAFSQAQAYADPCTVVATAPNAMTTSVECEMGKFSLQDAADGWTLVADDTNGNTGVLSSYTYQVVPAAGVVLPVVDRNVLQSIASSLVGQPQLEDGSAHVALTFLRDNLPLAGVTIISVAGLGGAITAYDSGLPGAYTDQSAATDVAGRVLLLNGDATATGATISVVDADGLPFDVTVQVRPDTLTLGGFDI